MIRFYELFEKHVQEALELGFSKWRMIYQILDASCPFLPCPSKCKGYSPRPGKSGFPACSYKDCFKVNPEYTEAFGFYYRWKEFLWGMRFRMIWIILKG